MKCPNCGETIQIRPTIAVFTKQLTKSGNSLVVSIPAEVCRNLSLHRGDFLKIKLSKF